MPRMRDGKSRRLSPRFNVVTLALFADSHAHIRCKMEDATPIVIYVPDDLVRMIFRLFFSVGDLGGINGHFRP